MSCQSQCKRLHLMVIMVSSEEVIVRPGRKEKSCTGGWPHPMVICSCFLSNHHYFLCNFPPWYNTLFLPLSKSLVILTQISLTSIKDFVLFTV